MLLQDDVCSHSFRTPLWLFSGASALLLLSCAGPGATPAASAGSGGSASSSSTGAPERELCDGSSGPRLIYQQTGGGQLGMGQTLLTQNGFRYLVVDGQCHYWTVGTKDMQPFWQETRTGTLTGAEAAALAAALDYPRWSSASASCQGADLSTEELWSEGVMRRITGAGLCDVGGSTGPYEKLTAEVKAARAWVDTLWTRGAPVAGPARLRVIRQPSDVPNKRPKVSWPLQVDIDSVAITHDADGVLTPDEPGYLLDSDPGLSVLRDYRTQLLAGSLSEYQGQELIITIEAKGALYNLFFRDTIPYENDKGLLRVPPP